MEPNQPTAQPHQLQAEAEKEPSRRGLSDYADTIRLLKDEKGFSFREIAAWFQQRSVTADHNAVWRAYSKLASPILAASISERNEHYERQTAHGGAMPWLEGS